MYTNLLVSLTLIGCVLATLDRTRLQRPPPALKYFDQRAWMGHWYCQFHMSPCSWKGGDEFRDYHEELFMDGKSVIAKEDWRKTDCVSAIGRYTPQGNGRYLGHDNIGNCWTGSVQVAAIDYKSFFIYYGCTKWDPFGTKCFDYWVDAYTRDRYPSKKVLSKIEFNLQRLFGLSTNDLIRMPQNKPCIPPPSKKYLPPRNNFKYPY